MGEERLEIRRSKKEGNYEINVYHGRGKAVYHNVLSPDAVKIAIILLDLEVTTSLPIYRAVLKYIEKRDNKDWMGL